MLCWYPIQSNSLLGIHVYIAYEDEILILTRLFSSLSTSGLTSWMNDFRAFFVEVV